MTAFWTGLILLALIVAGATVLIMSAHVPWLRALTGAAEPAREPVTPHAIRSANEVAAARRASTTTTTGGPHA